MREQSRKELHTKLKRVEINLLQKEFYFLAYPNKG